MNYLGLEIGGTKLQVGRGDTTGKLQWVLRRTIVPSEGAAGIRRQILEIHQEAKSTDKIDHDQPTHWGVGFGGPVDSVDGSILQSHQIDGWAGFKLADWLKSETGADSVTVRNDADTAALGEALSGAGQGLDPLAYITMGSGIGGGLILGGNIHLGAGRGAMEIGHLWIPDPDKPGSLQELELVASGWSIQRRAGKDSVQAVYESAKAGDERSSMVLKSAAQSVGLALSHVVHLVAPKRIILGGGVSLLPDDVWGNVVSQSLNDHTMDAFKGMTDVVPAALGESVVVVGAVRLAVLGGQI